MIHEKLINPPVQYRPTNYWGWLENMTPEETSRQVEEMAKAGLGGYVAHARGGVEHSFMDKQWIDSVKASIEKGTQHGMMNIIGDEDGWPSGFGAGHVVKKLGEKAHVKWLVCHRAHEPLEKDEHILGTYNVNGEEIRVSYVSTPFYVDNMDADVVKAFIEAIYDAYEVELGDKLNELYGIFTDEPQLARYGTPWSSTIPDVFKERWGCDIFSELYKIFIDCEGCETVRYRFWQLCADLFEINYAKQVGDWCRARNIVLTGHTTIEEHFAGQMQCNGATMQFYQHLDMPGMDWLSRIPVDNMNIKQVSSVAQQFGKERCLSEMYGCNGWNLSFDEMKWQGEWHYVLGINYMLQHLGLYSLKGSRKREYPASLFFQQPWWEDFNRFNDYFARLSMVMAQSKPVIDILVLHPIKSAWMDYDGTERDKFIKWQNDFKALTACLLDNSFDFHYGDENLLREHGKVENNTLRLEKGCYKTVVLPPMKSIDKDTVRLLKAFGEAGGKVLCVGSLPGWVNGVKSSEAMDQLRSFTILVPNLDALMDYMCSNVPRAIVVSDRNGKACSGVYACTSLYEKRRLYYIVNTNFNRAFDIQISTSNNAAISQLDLETCEEHDIYCSQFRLEPAQSLILLESSEKSAAQKEAPKNRGNKPIVLDGDWKVTASTLNSITLDYCRYAFNGGGWQDEIPVILLQEKLLKGRQNGKIQMEFSFICNEKPGVCDLVLETPEEFSIQINGSVVSSKPSGWWVDKCLSRIPVSEFIKEGENSILLERNFFLSERVYHVKNDPTVHEAESNRITFETELESIYLIGDFGVSQTGKPEYIDRRGFFADRSFVLEAAPQSVPIENMAVGGYPFFAGSITLKREFDWNGDNIGLLTINRPDAIVTKVAVNGKHVKTFTWAPYEADISGYLKKGKNTIELTMTNSLRNLMGPHHHADGELYGVGPYSYAYSTNKWTDKYCFVRFGIEGGIAIH